MKRQSLIIAVAAALTSTNILAATEKKPAAVPEEIDFNWSIETGLGYETNVFHAPDHSYADFYADATGNTIVNPDEQAGFFIPLKLRAGMAKPIKKYTDLVAEYRFTGKIYPESGLSDANSTKHKIKLGADTRLGKKGRRGNAYAGVFIRTHDKTYVDRDSGDPKLSSMGANVSDRYTYSSFGVEGDYERRVTRKSNLGVKAVLETLDYNDPVAWSEYDHTYTLLGAYWEYKQSKATKFSVGVNSEVRDYDDRHAYNANGSLLASNPLLTYSYLSYELGLRHRLSKETVVYLDYELRQRSDNHVGYNDMDQTSVKLRMIHDLNPKMRIRAKLRLFDRDYANAYNFEDPTQGSKSSSGSDLMLRGEYNRTDNKLYYVELEHRNRDNTDDRYEYTNTMVMMGAKWEF